MDYWSANSFLNGIGAGGPDKAAGARLGRRLPGSMGSRLAIAQRCWLSLDIARSGPGACLRNALGRPAWTLASRRLAPAEVRRAVKREGAMPSLDEKRGTQRQQILKAGTISFDGSGIDCLVRKMSELWCKSRGRKPNRHSQLIRLGYRYRAQQSSLSRCLAKGASDRYRVRLEKAATGPPCIGAGPKPRAQ